MGCTTGEGQQTRMTSSLSSTAAAASSSSSSCKSGTRTGSNPPPAPHTSSRVVLTTSSRRKLLFFSSTAATTGLILSPAGQANPFAGANVKPPSTPYSQSQQQFGLDARGRIRPCPSTNPGCVSTNPTVGASCSLASPLVIPTNTSTLPDKAASLRQAILKTQRNAVIKADEETAYGRYIQAEVDGGLLTLTAGGARDVMEFLLKEDQEQQVVVAYRCVATRVTFVYPFTTAVGDSKGQTQRIAAVFQDLGWYAPDLLNATH
ncbi:hypothetical protein E2562_038185 [Oryza meyeriana var. granulata]|uniref:Thylakoid lumenal 17.9 kDa protein, chloroplastic n=1 Tax=Oryza meyeriana var. granulata TaxID=110450 RepID=A0A6G1CM59_9ORYZ|nr:hypothetical protein E2562_038185 [Oryza meyeriana var. granulata]